MSFAALSMYVFLINSKIALGFLRNLYGLGTQTFLDYVLLRP